MAELALDFDNEGYQIRCLWAKVVKFTDATSCSVESVTGRCEASVRTFCGDFCGGNSLVGDIHAIPSQLEIIHLCGGPLGPWSAVGNDNSSYSSPCGTGQAAPALCDCATVACEAH
jgi:hypothetical protein